MEYMAIKFRQNKIEKQLYLIDMRYLRLGNQYRLNNISYDILNLFREKKSITDVLELIADEYNVNIEKLFCDSSTMLNFAIEKNVIEEMVE